MKILITGTAGFIGYHLVNKLIKMPEHNIVGLDNINNYYNVNLKYTRLKNTGIDKDNIAYNDIIQSDKYHNYQFIKLDLVDKEKLLSLFNEFKPDVVVNLAAQAGVRYSLENPDSYIQSNIVGFLNILECCRVHPVKHLVYASSSSVYGNNTKTPYSEKDKTDSPVSLYAATKKSNELLAHAYSSLYNIPSTGLRFFTVYGPLGRPDMAPMLFADAIFNKRPINIFNNGQLRRDFTYVEDITEGITRVITNTANEISPHSIYNIGCSNPILLMDFIETLEKTIGIEADKILLPMQQGDVLQTYADTTALNNNFSYTPSTSLKDGIKLFIDWYREYYNL